MISVRASGRIVVGTLLAATLGFAGTTPAVSGERAAPPRTRVDPGSLPVGAKAALPYLDGPRARLVLPSGDTVSTKRYGARGTGPDSELLHARDGFLIDSKERIFFLAKSGRSRLVTRGSSLRGAVVSSDGRWLITLDPSAPRRTATVRTIRISDGRVLDEKVFRKIERLGVMAAGGGRVLLDRTTKQGVTYRTDTIVWNPVASALRRLDRRTSRAWDATVASTATHRFVAVAGPRELVLDSRSGRQLWRVPKGEHVASFSPNDRRVVTLAGGAADRTSPWRTGEYSTVVRIRSARTGALLTTFVGTFASGAREVEPIWETRTSVLLHASGDLIWDEETESMLYPDPSVVRCSVLTARCARVPVSAFGASLLVRRSN